jgi:hypothetical protein
MYRIEKLQKRRGVAVIREYGVVLLSPLRPERALDEPYESLGIREPF